MKRRPKNVVVSFLNEHRTMEFFIVVEEGETMKERKKETTPCRRTKRDDDISKAVI
jgi:hypothetical protein